MRAISGSVVARDEQVDVVGLPRAKGPSEFATDEVGDGGWGELPVAVVAHAVELDIGLDVFGKLD